MGLFYGVLCTQTFIVQQHSLQRVFRSRVFGVPRCRNEQAVFFWPHLARLYMEVLIDRSGYTFTPRHELCGFRGVYMPACVYKASFACHHRPSTPRPIQRLIRLKMWSCMCHDISKSLFVLLSKQPISRPVTQDCTCGIHFGPKVLEKARRYTSGTFV